MFRKLSILTIVFIAAAASLFGQSLGDRHTEPAGKFSIEPPANWSSERHGGKGFNRFTNDKDEIFRASLNFTKARGMLDLDTFVDKTSEQMVTDYASAEMDGVDYDGKVRFITKEGLIGRKTIYLMKRGDVKYISVQYFFIDDRNFKYVIAFTDVADRRAASMKLFDAVAASFRLEP